MVSPVLENILCGKQCATISRLKQINRRSTFKSKYPESYVELIFQKMYFRAPPTTTRFGILFSIALGLMFWAGEP